MMLETAWESYLRLICGIVLMVLCGTIWAVVYMLITGNRGK